MWEPRRLTTLWAFTACYKDCFTFTALVNGLICRDSFGGANSCPARGLLVLDSGILLLDFDSTVILGSGTRGTHDQNFLSQTTGILHCHFYKTLLRKSSTVFILTVHCSRSWSAVVPIIVQFLPAIYGFLCCLRYCVTWYYMISVASGWLLGARGSVSDEVIAFFNLPSPSSRTMALRSSQPLTVTSTRNIPGGWRATGA
jgi:hypothetical protein